MRRPTRVPATSNRSSTASTLSPALLRNGSLRIARDIGKITNLETAPVTTVVGGAKMVDLSAATYRRR